MDLTRTASRLEPVQVESGLTARPDGSFAELTHQLAQQGMELAQVELRRLGAEVRERQRHAVRAAVALYLGGVVGALALAVLAGAAVLYLGRAWSDYAAAAAVTGGALLVLAAVAGGVLIGAARRIGGPREDREPAGEADERSRRNAA